MEVETQAKPKSQLDRVTQRVLETKEELWRRVTEVKPGCWSAKAELVHPSTKVKLEGRQSPTKPKWWRDKSQIKTHKSMAQAEL